MKAFRCQTENVIWVMVRYVPVAWCVRQFLRRGTAQLWVLLLRVDRSRCVERCGLWIVGRSQCELVCVVCVRSALPRE